MKERGEDKRQSAIGNRESAIGRTISRLSFVVCRLSSVGETSMPGEAAISVQDELSEVYLLQQCDVNKDGSKCKN